jgi:hypothetical protein
VGSQAFPFAMDSDININLNRQRYSYWSALAISARFRRPVAHGNTASQAGIAASGTEEI